MWNMGSNKIKYKMIVDFYKPLFARDHLEMSFQIIILILHDF
jgi:hypothetical protein